MLQTEFKIFARLKTKQKAAFSAGASPGSTNGLDGLLRGRKAAWKRNGKEQRESKGKSGRRREGRAWLNLPRSEMISNDMPPADERMDGRRDRR